MLIANVCVCFCYLDEQVINRFKNLGYDIGSTNDVGEKYYVNIFWNEK